MPEDLSGRRLGHYRIDQVIGRGGMSVLYRATDLRLGRKVALKVIGDQLAADPEFRERFVDEARNTSAIDHSHVVPLYDFDEVDGLLYIAMRYVEGSDLASLIKDGPLAPTRTTVLLDQVAQALDALHTHGLVHLDVKPANVLVTTKESAGSEHVYLADFGLTRRGATGHRTRSGDFLGSPTYAAPEHLRGEPVDARTDQYSLTCVLFACLSGRPPFQGSVPEVIAGHLGATAPPITSLVLLPAAIEQVVARGLAKDPGSRYASCAQLLVAASGALAGLPATAAAGPPQPVRPEQGQAGAGAAGQFAGPAAGPGRPGPYQGSTRPPGPPPGAPQPIARHPAAASRPPGTPYPQHLPQHRPAPAAGAGARPPGQASMGPPAVVRPGTPPPVARMAQPGPPMRLRDPLPAQPTAFGGGRSGGGSRWLVPVILAVVAVAVVVILVVLFTGDSGGGGGPVGPQTDVTHPSASIPIGGGDGGGGGLPTVVPTVGR